MRQQQWQDEQDHRDLDQPEYNKDYFGVYDEAFIVPPAPLMPEAFQPPGMHLDEDARAEHDRALHVALTNPSVPLSHYRAPYALMTRRDWGPSAPGYASRYPSYRQPWPSTQYTLSSPRPHAFHQQHQQRVLPPRGTLNSPEKIEYLQWRLTVILHERQVQQQWEESQRRVRTVARTSSNTTAGSMTTSSTAATFESRTARSRQGHDSRTGEPCEHERASSSNISNGLRTTASSGRILRGTDGSREGSGSGSHSDEWHGAVGNANISMTAEQRNQADNRLAPMSAQGTDSTAAGKSNQLDDDDDDEAYLSSDEYHDPREFLHDGCDPMSAVGQQAASRPPSHGKRPSVFQRASLKLFPKLSATARTDSQLSVTSTSSFPSPRSEQGKITSLLRRNNKTEVADSACVEYQLNLPAELSPTQSASFTTAHASSIALGTITSNNPSSHHAHVSDRDNVIWHCTAREVDLMR